MESAQRRSQRSCEWVETVCFQFCARDVYWSPASGHITRRLTVIIAFGGIRTFSKGRDQVVPNGPEQIWVADITW